MKDPIYIEPIENEKKFQRLAELGARLKVPVSEAFLTLRITNSKGEVIHHTRQRSHSWTRNAYNTLATTLMGIRNTGGFAAGGLSSKQTDGTVTGNNYLHTIGGAGSTFNYSSESAGFGFVGAIASPGNGIVVGRGVAAESFDDYALGTVCTEGTGANQLNHMAMSAPQRSWNAGTRTFTVVHSRYINNNSPGTITITEIAIIGNGSLGQPGMKFRLFSRDVLLVPVDVPASGQILVTYTFALVYPS